MPIGNLTSQIFSNIYLNEFDRYVKHNLKPLAYLRYGDDFVIFDKDFESLQLKRELAESFLSNILRIDLHSKNNIIVKAKHGIKFLGTVIYPTGRRLNKRSRKRIKQRLNDRNISSYFGLIKQNEKSKKIKEFAMDTILLKKL